MNRWSVLLVSGLVLAWGWGAPSSVVRAEPETTAKQDEGSVSAKAAGDAKAPEHAPHGDEGKAKGNAGHQEDDHPPRDVHAHGGEHASGDHGHHDPTDLTHGNGSSQLMAAQEMRFDLAIATFIVFLLLLAILTKFAWGPISHGLDQREETIARQIAEAKAASEKAARQLQEYEVRLAAATEEARQIVSQSRKDAEVAKEKIVAEARDAAGKERDRAIAEITAAKNQALHEIAEKSVNTAVSLASSIIRREVRPEDHDQLINQSLQQFTSLN